MKIIVEGYDASGKSTLAQALADRLGLSVLEAGPKPPSDKQALIDSYMQFNSANVVHCRITPISRQAYQLDCSDAHYRELQNIVQRYAEEDAIFIYCTGEADDHQVKDYDTPGHLEYLSKNQDTIKSRYDRIFSKINHIKYDFKVDSMEDFVCKIEMYFCGLTI